MSENQRVLLQRIEEKRNELCGVIDESDIENENLSQTKILAISVEFDELISQYYSIEKTISYCGC